MAQAEVAYLEYRAAVEAKMAERATSSAAVKAHHEMSKAYLESAEALKRGDDAPQ